MRLYYGGGTVEDDEMIAAFEEDIAQLAKEILAGFSARSQNPIGSREQGALRMDNDPGLECSLEADEPSRQVRRGGNRLANYESLV